MALDETMKLGWASLPAFAKSVRVPRYSREDLRPGIVHIGLGNFHRAHQAWYLHRLMDQGLAQDWAIIGAGVRPADHDQRQRLLDQDCLTTLIELDPSGKSAEIIGSIIDFVPVTEENGPLIAQMADPRIRIVSMTVTEGGYYQNASGAFDSSDPDITHDAAHPDRPRTAFGAIIAALKHRRAAGLGPFTCQSCDNLQGNGDILKATLIGLARMSDPDLADWIAAEVSFPNSMVDCIVPATGARELDLARGFGISDNAPVTHENFRQWVTEDDFCAGRPDWDKVGVTLTQDVHAFEAMKLRLLNAGHQVIATPAELLSLDTIADAMAHPLIRQLFRKIATEEIVPHVKPVPGMTPLDYVDLIETRFENPEIYDTIRRVAYDGSARHAGFLHPILRDALAKDAPIDGLALIEALWARMCTATREDGSKIEANDPFWPPLTAAARDAQRNPQHWISQSQFYGSLGQDQRFADRFLHWHSLLSAHGTEATLETYLGIA